jgi:hypothetical protein
MHDKARLAYLRIANFLAGLRENAEQLDPLAKWYRIFSEALRHFLHGRNSAATAPQPGLNAYLRLQFSTDRWSRNHPTAGFRMMARYIWSPLTGE